MFDIRETPRENMFSAEDREILEDKFEDREDLGIHDFRPVDKDSEEEKEGENMFMTGVFEENN